MTSALHSSMGAAEYRHAALGPISLNCLADAFQEARPRFQGKMSECADLDGYRTQSTFCVQPEARRHAGAQQLKTAIE